MIGEEEFSFSGKKVVDPGFTALMTWQAIPPEENFPQLKEGDTLTIKEIKLSERQTSPPGKKIDIFCSSKNCIFKNCIILPVENIERIFLFFFFLLF
jgi:DNA topoisomerase